MNHLDSQAQLDELVRLRHEASQLRAKAEAAEQLRAENHEIRVRLVGRVPSPGAGWSHHSENCCHAAEVD